MSSPAEKVESRLLDRLSALLGEDVFFVPCDWGTKKPLVTYVERPFAGTKSEAYRALFQVQEVNIAVYLGQASGGLCAIDFDHDQDLAAFLAVNPRLERTTRSRGSRGGMIWVRIGGNPGSEGRTPSTINHQPSTTTCTGKHFEWRADKRLSTIYGRHPAGMDYALVMDAPPVVLRFAEIVWPPGWELPWVTAAGERAAAELVKAYGQPFYTNKEGKVTGVNERYWAGLYARENQLFYDPDEKTFYLYADKTGLWEVVTGDSIRETISCRILEVSREAQQFTLEIQITQARLNAVVSALKGIVERRGAFKSKQRFIHVANGVIRFAEAKEPLVRIVQALVGLNNTYQLRTDCLYERFETYRYRGKTLLIGPDVRGDFLMERGASMLKVLVGGDPISAEGKCLNGDFQMFGTFNIVVTCNSRLRVRLEGDAGAWRRRLLVVRYEKPPPTKRILDFDHVLLRDEGAGILRWALAGFVKLQTQFADSGDFKLTDAQRGRVDSLLAESDSLRLFVHERMVRNESLAGGQLCDVTTSEISQAYAEFCADRGWNALATAVVERTLPDIMLDVFHVTKSHSIERDGKKSNRGFRKVALVDRHHADLALGDNS